MAFTPFSGNIPPETITDQIEKGTPVVTDELLIADSQDSYSSKKIQIGNLPLPFSSKNTVSLSLLHQTNTVIPSLTFDSTQLDAIDISYKFVQQDGSKAIGNMKVVTDGTNVSFANTYNEVGSINFTFNAQMNGSDVEITYTNSIYSGTLTTDINKFNI